MRNVVVQKFGGTSVRDAQNRTECFKKIKKEVAKGNKVIVVVSAMGRKGEPYATDTLISLAQEIQGKERDLLMASGELISASVFSSELKQSFLEENKEGKRVSVLTGGEAGIVTDNRFNRANIISFETENIEDELLKNDVLVVAGFQGRTVKGEITTLGRGGSDTSAVALGVATKADKIEIFSDVNGMMSADPRMVADARMIRSINYEDALNLSYYGSKVIDSRALEIGKKYNARIVLKSTFTDDTGTIISSDIIREAQVEGEKGMFSGIAYKAGLVSYRIQAKKPEEKTMLLGKLKLREVSLDMINIEKQGVGFIVEEESQKTTEKVLSEMGLKYEKEEQLSKLALVGEKIAGVPGVMQSIAEPMFENGVEIIQTSDSHTTICVLLKEDQLKKSLCLLHQKFFDKK